MSRIPFFLTPHQRYDAGRGVPEHPFQLGVRSKAGEAVEVVEGLLGFHRSIHYKLYPKYVKFSKSFYRQQTVKNDPY